MLRWLPFARFAIPHSPEKEQRLVAFSINDKNPTNKGTEEPAESEGTESRPQTSNATGTNIDAVRKTLFKVALRDLDPSSPDQVDRLSQEYWDVLKPNIVKSENGAPELVEDLIGRMRSQIISKHLEEEPFLLELGRIDTEEMPEEDQDAFVKKHEVLIDRYLSGGILNSPAHQIINLLQALFSEAVSKLKPKEEPAGPQAFFLFETGKDVNDRYEKSGIQYQYAKLYVKNTLDPTDYYKDESEFDKAFAEPIEKKLNEIMEGKLRCPKAFKRGNKLYFNRDLEEYRDATVVDSNTDPPLTAGRINRERAITHELTHYEIDLPYRGESFIRQVLEHMKKTGKWEELKEAIDKVYANNIARENLESDADYVHEALTYYLSGIRHPYGPGLPQAVFEIMSGIVDGSDDNFRKLISSLERDVQEHETFMENKFDEQLDLDRENQDFANAVQNDSGYDPEQVRLAEKKAREELGYKADVIRAAEAGDETPPESPENGLEDGAKTPKQKHEPAALLDKVEDLKDKNVVLRNLLEKIEKQGIPPSMDRAMYEAARAGANRIVAQNLEDLDYASSLLNPLKNWESGSSIEEKAKHLRELGLENADEYERLARLIPPDPKAEEAADRASAGKRDKIAGFIEEALKAVEKPMEDISTFADNADKEAEKPTTVFGTIKKGLFDNVHWLTFFDIIKIYSIFKESVLDNYHNRQKVRTFDFAQNFNFYKPIQETINKQARAANQEETQKYLEYLQKKGCTCDELFGEDGEGNSGLIRRVGTNTNYAKAVLEYAADHAWLYKFNKNARGTYDGHDVYGIDYEGIFGKEAFRELVQKNEAGKKKEFDRGYERVDKDADIPPIIDVMLEELEEKNIFAVGGLMKRLQEKAKLSHSNTWALTTLFGTMRGKYLQNKTPEKVRGLLNSLDKGLIDFVSNFTIGQSAWSITWLKVLRHYIDPWRKNPDATPFTNNILTKTIDRIERRMVHDGTDKEFPNRKDFDEAVAYVLSGKTLKQGESIGGRVITNNIKPISIFEDEFTDYRNKFFDTASTSTEPTKTDDDFWNPKNGGSDVLLLGRIPTAQILERKSTGTFEYQIQARGYFAQVFNRFDDLTKEANQAPDASSKASILKARDNFIADMRKKLFDEKNRAGWIYGGVLGNNTSLKQFPTEQDTMGRIILDELLKVGIISSEIHEEIKRKAANIK